MSGKQLIYKEIFLLFLDFSTIIFLIKNKNSAAFLSEILYPDKKIVWEWYMSVHFVESGLF